ncbi:hypothetical protein [Microbacterium sp. 1S1]|uniref:hypothetical protein n=1 Tax=Microbacterium sp. 1S1 TaxID=2606451 RepID=UPI0021CCDFE9|nr:hypothetical protein [Microbacterium sp. 1S1]
MLGDPQHVARVVRLHDDELRLRADPLTSEHGDRLGVAAPRLRLRDPTLQEPEQPEHCGEREPDPQREQEVVQGQASTFSRMRVIRTA